MADYIDNKRFLNELIQYKNLKNESLNNKTQPTVSNYIGQCIILIAENFAKKPCFRMLEFKEELVLDAIEVCFKKLDKFDPQKSSNPFAYFTQVCYFEFLSCIRKESKHKYLKKKLINNCLEDVHFSLSENDLDQDYANSLRDLLKDNITEAEYEKYEGKSVKNVKKNFNDTDWLFEDIE